MKRIVEIISVKKRKNIEGLSFFLASVLLDDGETYTVAHDEPPEIGDSVYAWFDDQYQRPKAAYPK